MLLGQRRQAVLQLHRSDQQFHCLLKCGFYYRFVCTHGIQFLIFKSCATSKVAQKFSGCNLHIHLRYHGGTQYELTHWGRDKMAGIFVDNIFLFVFLSWNCSIWIPIWITHGDVIKLKPVPRYWPFVRGIHRSPVNFPHKGQWRGALMFSLICVWINGWVNNREAGNLRRYGAHYDVIVMFVSNGPISNKPGLVR